MSVHNLNYKSQLRKLYAFNALGNISIAGAAWVLLLVSQGYSLIQVGIAETVFHLVSITCEIPSGVFADVFGRKRSLMMSCLATILSALTRAYWDSFTGVLVSIAFSALSYNFFTGSDSALAYDTLAEADRTPDYDRYISNQTIIYRIANGAATLAAGIAVMIGNTMSQLLSVLIATVQFVVVLGLRENNVITSRRHISVAQRFRSTVIESVSFMRGNRRAALLILRNCIVGAVDILLLFFLQARLPLAGVTDLLLGPLLFIMSMGGVIGARASSRVRKWKFGRLFALCLVMVVAGFMASFTSVPLVMTMGGFLAAFADDMIQIRADIELNNMIPSAQRATLISVSSFCFSAVMIVLSPLAGWVFGLQM
ncbi:Major Facilitator Superfamily protein [Ruminococcaceae bacterium YRB3002]|nr:Major Facilitator Superfamily protein [Ruminococcaceae bacterium YRB3002]